MAVEAKVGLNLGPWLDGSRLAIRRAPHSRSCVALSIVRRDRCASHSLPRHLSGVFNGLRLVIRGTIVATCFEASRTTR